MMTIIVAALVSLAVSTAAASPFTVAAMADTVPPETTISGWFSSTTPFAVSFGWTGSDDVTTTEHLTYAFQLVGLDPTFSPFGSATTTTYSNPLAPGRYVFRVIARDQAGNVDPLGGGLSFTVDQYGAVVLDSAGTVSSVRGSVQVIVQGTSMAVAPGSFLPFRAEIRTGADGRVESKCTLGGGRFIVGPDSSVFLPPFSSCASFEVTHGELQVLFSRAQPTVAGVSVEAVAQTPFQVLTPVSMASTFLGEFSFTTTYSQAGRTGTATTTVQDGQVSVYDPGAGAGVSVVAGQTVETTGQVPELVAAVLPSSRAVQVGSTATAFATIINAGAISAIACRLELLTDVPAAFSFWATTPDTNEVTGPPRSTPLLIGGGAAQSFVFTLTPNAPIPPTEVELGFKCGGTSAPTMVGVNTLSFSASAEPVPDIVAVAATLDNTGIVVMPAATGVVGVGAFAVAISNVGAAGTITVSADTAGASLPVATTVCQTDAAGGCVAPAAPSIALLVPSNATATFAIFVASGGSVPFDPARHRIFVRFTDGAGVTRGSTSVAVRTP